jgi:hypothetical protein
LVPVFSGTFSDWAPVIWAPGLAAVGVSGESESVAHPKTANDNMTKERLFVIGALLDCADRIINKQATCPGQAFLKRVKNRTIK